jgi:ORF6N domain
MAITLKPENVARLVFFVRGEKVMLDTDLAQLYRVTTGNLNKAVKRNQARFPGDFMFQLTEKETDSLIFQLGRSKGRGGRRHRPYAFTEQGVAMLSSVLNSERAVQVNIAIMRTFVQLRRLMDSNADLARKIESLEKKYDEKFAVVFAAIKQLITPPEPPRRRIGFHPPSK